MPRPPDPGRSGEGGGAGGGRALAARRVGEGTLRYVEPLFRPPSEAASLILQATLGCSHNRCTYCAMYRGKPFEVRPIEALRADLEQARRRYGGGVDRLFVADGDPLAMSMEHWEALLTTARALFPGLRQVSTYATAMNLLEKGSDELVRLRALGLDLLYIGPESGDDVTLKAIAKGADAAAHAEAAARARAAGMRLSAIFLLGCAGVERSAEHAAASARLASAMDPAFLSALTVTVVPGTPLHRLQARGGFQLPDVRGLLAELRVFVAGVETTDALFRTNHASNYLPLAGRLPRDRDRLLEVLDAALSGRVPLRPEWMRGL